MELKFWLPGMTVPSYSCIINVGSSTPRLGSITSREKLEQMTGAFNFSPKAKATLLQPMSYAMWRFISDFGNPRGPFPINLGIVLVA